MPLNKPGVDGAVEDPTIADVVAWVGEHVPLVPPVVK